MRSRALATVLWVGLGLGAGFGLAASLWGRAPRASRLAHPPADAAATFTPDKGRFRITQDGSEAGSETFELSQSDKVWIARSDTTIHAGKSESHSTGQLRLNADGTPTHYEWNSQTPKKASGSVDFSGSIAKTSITLEGKDPYHQDFTFDTPRVAVLDNNLYDQYAVLAVLYDWNAKGKQSFPVLIPQDLTPGSIEVESLGQQSIKGTSVDVLRASTPDVEIDLYLDSRHHLVRLEVPAAKVVVERQ